MPEAADPMVTMEADTVKPSTTESSPKRRKLCHESSPQRTDGHAAIESSNGQDIPNEHPDSCSSAAMDTEKASLATTALGHMQQVSAGQSEPLIKTSPAIAHDAAAAIPVHPSDPAAPGNNLPTSCAAEHNAHQQQNHVDRHEQDAPAPLIQHNAKEPSSQQHEERSPDRSQRHQACQEGEPAGSIISPKQQQQQQPQQEAPASPSKEQLGAKASPEPSMQQKEQEHHGGAEQQQQHEAQQPAEQEQQQEQAAKGPKVFSRKRPRKPKQLLSFEDELEDDGEGSAPAFSLSSATATRFKKERPLQLPITASAPSMPAAAASQLQRLVVDDDATAPADARSLAVIHYGTAHARGMRPYMEDRHTVVASLLPSCSDGVQRSYAAVFDGHNGIITAELAATRLHTMLAAEPAVKAATGARTSGSLVASETKAISDAMQRCFLQVDELALDAARKKQHRDGATAVCVLRLGEVAYVAHAGDSRAVLCSRGSARRLTEDHKPDLPRERSRVEQQGGRVEYQRCWRVVVEPRDGRPGSGLAVSRSLGDLDFKEPGRYVEAEPDVARVELRAGDEFLLLASDGLWDVLSDQEACDVARQVLQVVVPSDAAGIMGSSGASTGGRHTEALASAMAQALVDKALAKGTCDNVTALVMLLTWA